MDVKSDPQLKAAQRPGFASFGASAGASPVVRERHLPVARPTWARVSAYVALTVATVAVGLRLLASALAVPLDAPAAAAAPAWMVEVTTASAKTTTALVYGREVGVHLVQVPAGKGGQSAARVVPARLARGELHLVSLDFTSLRVHASAPRGATPMAFSATSPIITAYQTPREIGVRTGW